MEMTLTFGDVQETALIPLAIIGKKLNNRLAIFKW